MIPVILRAPVLRSRLDQVPWRILSPTARSQSGLAVGTFYGYLDWDPQRPVAQVRDSVLASFTRLGLLLPETADILRSLDVDRCGFHVHVETRVDPDDRDRLRTLLEYLTRSPVALERIHYVESTGQVTLRTKKGATLASN